MLRSASRRRPTWAALLAAVIAAGVLATAAVAASFTLKVARHAKVTSVTTGKTTHPNVVVNSKGFVVYTLTGDSRKHPECVKANKCFMFWPPVTVKSLKSLRRAPGVKGKLSTWRRSGFIQVLLDGHPLYTFKLDKKPAVATGEGIGSFGGTWHVRLAVPAKSSSSPSSGAGSGGSW